MGTLKYLIIHCTDTPPERKVTSTEIKQWHMGPRDNPDGTVTYLGKSYKNRLTLPNDFIGGVPVKKLTGRGWDRVGYSDMIHLDGEIENLTPYNEDDEITVHEMTWGATGVNAISRHIVYVGGGYAKFGLQNLTDAQFISLEREVRNFLHLHPKCKISGHYHFTDKKLCPNFPVEELCELVGIPSENIYKKGDPI